jgi:hypothetical protein
MRRRQPTDKFEISDNSWGPLVWADYDRALTIEKHGGSCALIYMFLLRKVYLDKKKDFIVAISDNSIAKYGGVSRRSIYTCRPIMRAARLISYRDRTAEDDRLQRSYCYKVHSSVNFLQPQEPSAIIAQGGSATIAQAVGNRIENIAPINRTSSKEDVYINKTAGALDAQSSPYGGLGSGPADTENSEEAMDQHIQSEVRRVAPWSQQK